MSEYEYSNISSEMGEIRLLTFADNEVDCPIRVSLSTAHLDDAPHYSTISYCWGDEAERSTLLVNNLRLKVPLSAHAALTRVRELACDTPVWIDALCINQQNLREREGQVALMSIVYRSAVSNFIFLGNKDATSALRGIAVLSHELLKETQEVELADVLRPRGQWASSNKPLTTTPPYEDLREFFDLPWFRRVWVIQEATLAKKNVCICGVAIFDLISVVRAGVWLLHKEHFLNDAGLTRTLNRALGLFDLLDHDQGYYATHRHTLYNLLRMIQGLECKIPSDRVFGIYGMLEHFQIPGWQDLRPDYALPMERVFEKATRTALADMNGDLLPLQQVSHVDEIAMRRGPSWVPDYSISNQDERLSNELRAQFEASSGSKRDSQLDFGFSNAGQLAVAGFVIGTIVGTTAPIFCKRLSTAQHLSERFDRIEALVEQHCPDDIQSRFALSTVPLTLTGGQRASCSELMEWEAFRNSMNGSLQGTLEHEVRDKASLPASLGLYLDTLEACLNRKVFAVENGFIGLGPLLTDCNDIVVVLEGLQWPAVLRPSMTGFYFLGVAYVHDIMDGAWYRSERSRRRPLEYFTLI